MFDKKLLRKEWTSSASFSFAMTFSLWSPQKEEETADERRNQFLC